MARPGMAGVNPWRIALFSALGAVSVGLPVLQLVGVPLFWGMAAAAIPWALTMWRRGELATAVTIPLISALWVSLALLLVDPYLHLALVPVFSTVTAIAGVGGLVFLARTWGVRSNPAAHHDLSALGVLAGPIAWVTALAAAGSFTTGRRLSWAMLNDSPNYIIQARAVLALPGFDRGPTSNPVPLPSGIVALAAAAGRDSTLPRDLLLHDVTAYSAIWAALVALTCALSGLLAITITRRISDRRFPALISGVIGSALPLSWFVTGYALEYGFFNADIALPLVISAIVICLDRRLRLAWRTFWLAICVTLMLSVWSPLVLVPLGLLLANVVLEFRSIPTLRRRDWVVIGLGIAQAAGYSLAVAVPAFLAQRIALAGAGGIYQLPPSVVFIAGAAVLLVAAVEFRTARSSAVGKRHRLLGMSAAVVSGWLGVAALLFLSRKSENPWGYYPLKYAWLMTVIFFILLVGLLVGLVARSARTRLLRRIGVGLVAVATACLFAWLPESTPKYTPLDPISRVLGLRLDNKHPDASFNEAVLTLTDPTHPRILWRSTLSDDDEGEANIWFTLFRSNSLDSSDLRIIGLQANAIRTLPVLCSMAELMGPDTEIITADPGLSAQFSAKCSGSTARVVLDPRRF